MTRWILVLACGLLATACAGPTAPTPVAAPAPLAGVWRGELTFPGSAPVSTEWTFTVLPDTRGSSYTAAIVTADPSPWFANTTAGATAIGSAFESDGPFSSRRACVGPAPSFQTSGTLDSPTTPTRLTAAFTGVECGQVFAATLTLTKR